MSSTAQTVHPDIATVNDTVNKLKREYHNKELREVCSGTVAIGLFGNLAGAEVAVEQRVEVGNTGEYVCVRNIVAVTCTGFGCTDPFNEVATRDLIFDCDHGERTEEHRVAARRWAQDHAETCRAMPRPTA